MCPLKDAARDAPDQIAILSKEATLTFSELDRLVNTIEEEPLQIQSSSPLFLIPRFFAAFRRQKSLFPINPRLPHHQILKEAPPQSVLLYTSGSTGTPKIAVLSLANLIANAASAIPKLDLKPNDQWKLSLPLYHVGGIGIVMRCLLARATVVLDDSPEITHLSYVPTHLYRATPIYKKLRCLLLGGAPIGSYPQHLPVYTTYGLTEMSSMVTLNGQVLPDREVCLSSEGEILVKGACLFQGYLGEEPPTGWFATGDLGKFEKGLIVTGRKDWMFISGGENIQPEEIEKELLALSDVEEAVVVAKEDAEFGKRPVAIVRAQKTFDLKQMQRALRERLPKYKIPIELHLMEEIPKKNDFKVDRFILSQMVNNQRDKNTSGQKK